MTGLADFIAETQRLVTTWPEWMKAVSPRIRPTEEGVNDVSGVTFDFWPLPRAMTRHWGNGSHFWQRMVKLFGEPDAAFGVTDGIPEGPMKIDRNTGYEWADLPFSDNQFRFGYWDPPYDKLYRPEGIEIWRTCQKLAIYHTHVYPTSWFIGAKRTGMVAVTQGPLKQIRILQVFDKQQGALL